MNQTKIYAIFITAVLILGGPAGYFFTTKDMTLEIQQKDEKIAKALDTLQKAKSSIENKDKTISEKEEEVKVCNEELETRNSKIKSLEADLENAYAGISDDIISTEEIVIEKSSESLSAGEIIEDSILDNEEKIEVAKNDCPVCEKCENSNTQVVKSSGNNFDEKIVLETMDLAYNKRIGKTGLPYVEGTSKTLLEMYNGDDEILKSKVSAFCSDEYLNPEFYGAKKKSIVLSYERSYCKDGKYENCSKEIKEKIDEYKSEKVLPTEVVRILTKYDEGTFENVEQEVFAIYNHFGERVCSWTRNTSSSGVQNYVQL